MRILYQIARQFRINFLDRRYWKRISETILKSRWKWTEIVKLKEDKQVGENFIQFSERYGSGNLVKFFNNKGNV